MLRDNGFTLIELLIVITIIGIGAGIATMNFNSYVKKSNIEKQTKELFADLNEARLKAIYVKKRHSIVMNPYNYVFKIYSSENESNSGGNTIYSKNTLNLMTTKTGAALDGNIFEFDTRGFLVGTTNTIRINPVSSGAAFDCVIISDSRTNLGQMGSGNACNQK